LINYVLIPLIEPCCCAARLYQGNLIMTITFFKDILNVWYSDAHRVCVFIVLFALPLWIMFIRRAVSFQSSKHRSLADGHFKTTMSLYMPDIFFIISFISFGLGIAGVGQLRMPWTIDAACRGAGSVLLISGLMMFLTFSRIHNELYVFDREQGKMGFYGMVRHPYYALLLLISLGMTLSVVSVFSAGVLVIQIIVSTLCTGYIGKVLIAKDEYFIDYKYAAPRLVPGLADMLRGIVK